MSALAKSIAKTPVAQAIERMDPALRDLLDHLVEPTTPEVFERRLDEIGEYCAKFGQKECPHEYDHQFPEGIYYRQVTKEPMNIVLGARHRLQHQCILLSGTQILFTSDGPVAMHGPFAFIGEAGSRKLHLNLTRVVFANVFPNPDNCHDIEELERRLAYPDQLEIERGEP